MATSYVDFTTTFGDIVIELYDDDAPLTVANFLSYAKNPTAGDNYNSSFFHRLVPGFVLQGGGFDDGAVTPNTITAIPTEAPVQNEFDPNHPNVEGTIAMAKTSGDPNSATDQFFFNLGDNSANLDSQNGGFTVFGQVVAGWNVVEEIAALPVVNAGAPFDSLPVHGTIPSTGITSDQLVLVTNTQAATYSLVVNDTADHVIDRAEARAVTYSVSGLAAGTGAVATFTDGVHSATASVAADGSFAIDLSHLSGLITSQLAIADKAGVAESTTGNAVPVTGTRVAADFDGSGDSDILFRNTASAETYLWTMNNGTVTNGVPTSTQVGSNWQIAGVGDFDNSGTADLLWLYDNTANAADPLNGISYITFQNGAAASAASGIVEQLSTQWRLAGVGDFDGDGKADILWRNASTGQTYLDLMNGTRIETSSGFTTQQVADPNWQVAGVDDFNGDGRADVLWRYDNTANASDALNGAAYIWTMNGTTVTSAGLMSQQAGSADWAVAGTGDFDGNGTSDILFRYDDTANVSDPLNGITYIDFMNGPTVTSGAPTQWQVDESWVLASVGDFNGDGKSDLLFQQKATGNTFIWDMNGTAVTTGVGTTEQAGLGWTVQNGVPPG